MRKAIAIATQDHGLAEYLEELDMLEVQIKDRLAFLDKQREDVMKNFKESTRPIWEEIKMYLREKGMLPEDFDPKKYHFHYDDEAGIVFICDEEKEKHEPPFVQFLRQMGAVPINLSP